MRRLRGHFECNEDLTPTMLFVGLVERLKQVANRKESSPENGRDQIDIVTGAVLKSPLHIGKQTQGLAHG